MGKKYMDQDLFDYMVATIAHLSLIKNKPKEAIFDELWESYKKSIVDDNIKEDILSAVERSIINLTEWGIPAHLKFFEWFRGIIRQYDRQWNKKPRKILEGLWFQKSTKNPNRVEDYIKRMTEYYLQFSFEKRAKDLVMAARAAAIPLYSLVGERFNSIWELDEKAWDFFVTVTYVYCALTVLFPTVDAEKYELLHGIVTTELNNWDHNGKRALEDCVNFVDRTIQGMNHEFALAEVLGTWVLWNLYGRAPSYEEGKPAREIGGVAITSMGSWWD